MSKLSVELSNNDIILAYAINEDIESTGDNTKIVTKEIDIDTVISIGRATASNVRLALLREAIK